MPERLRFEDEDENSAVDAVKTGYSAANALNRAAESSAKRQQKRAVKREYAAKRYENMRREAECAEKAAETTSKPAKSGAEKLAEFLKEHKKGAAIALAIVALLLIARGGGVVPCGGCLRHLLAVVRVLVIAVCSVFSFVGVCHVCFLLDMVLWVGLYWHE